jgi:hypothetical protein
MTEYLELSVRCAECEKPVPDDALLIKEKSGETVGVFCDKGCWEIYRLRLVMFEQIAKMARISNQEDVSEEIKAWIRETHRRVCTGE